MADFRIGFIYTRCFLQKELKIRDGVSAKPLLPTGSRGELHNVRALLNQAGFNFNANHLAQTIEKFKDQGQTALVLFDSVSAPTFENAVESAEREAESIAGALAVMSTNPTVPLCAFAQGKDESGYKLYLSADNKVRHATNVHGYLDATPDIAKHAISHDKYALLLRLYRASLRELDIDNQILFQLVLLEEASDQSDGKTFAERLRAFCAEHKLQEDLDFLAREIEIALPKDKDVIDALVKLRNSCAHNGRIDKATLAEYKGEWLFPILEDKPKLHKLVSDTIRYIFSALAGHSREKMATTLHMKPGEPFTLRFD